MEPDEEYQLPAIFKYEKYVEMTLKGSVTAQELGEMILSSLDFKTLPIVIIDERKKT